MKLTRREIPGLICSLVASGAAGQSATHALPGEGLARGFNLPDMAPRVGAGLPVAQLKELRAVGFTHVRLPIAGESFMPRFSGPATIGFAMRDLEMVVDKLLELNFVVSVDMHPGKEFARLLGAQPDGAMDELRLAWTQMAPRLRSRDAARVFAELLNEPATTDVIWRPRVETLAQRLRQEMPQTRFIVGPAPFQRVEALAAWRPLDDENVLYAFHYYDPMAFTHQGLTWNRSDPLSRLADFPFPAQQGDRRIETVLSRLRAEGDASLLSQIEATLRTAWNEEKIRSQFAALREWSAIHKRPVILNEFGALRFRSRRADRLRWLASVRRAAEESGFGWAHWDFSGGFGLATERGVLDAGVIDALMGANAGVPRR